MIIEELQTVTAMHRHKHLLSAFLMPDLSDSQCSHDLSATSKANGPNIKKTDTGLVTCGEVQHSHKSRAVPVSAASSITVSCLYLQKQISRNPNSKDTSVK